MLGSDQGDRAGPGWVPEVRGGKHGGLETERRWQACGSPRYQRLRRLVNSLRKRLKRAAWRRAARRFTVRRRFTQDRSRAGSVPSTGKPSRAVDSRVTGGRRQESQDGGSLAAAGAAPRTTGRLTPQAFLPQAQWANPRGRRSAGPMAELVCVIVWDWRPVPSSDVTCGESGSDACLSAVRLRIWVDLRVESTGWQAVAAEPR